MNTLTARTTGTRNGKRFFTARTFQRVTAIERDFIPASDTRPAQEVAR